MGIRKAPILLDKIVTLHNRYRAVQPSPQAKGGGIIHERELLPPSLPIKPCKPGMLQTGCCRLASPAIASGLATGFARAREKMGFFTGF
jgi:hypothetical protein